MHSVIDARTVARRLPGKKVYVRSLWNVFGGQASDHQTLPDGNETLRQVRKGQARGCGASGIRLSTCITDAAKLAGRWCTGVYQKGDMEKVGLLTQQGVIMVRYTGTINAHRH